MLLVGDPEKLRRCGLVESVVTRLPKAQHFPLAATA